MIWSQLRDHLLQAVAGAAVLGTGAVVVTGQITDGRHDERIKTIESVAPKVDKILENQALTNERLAKIEAKVSE